MQSWSLERKIRVSQTRIIEFAQKTMNEIYVSFSGGKDSTVLLDMVRRVYPDTKAVFVDTGLEYPELREFVKTVDNVVWLKPEMNFKKVITAYGYPVISKEVARCVDVAQRHPDGRTAQLFNPNSDRVKEKTEKYGKNWGRGYVKYQYLLDAPFKISNKCCDVMKKKPTKKYTKETHTYPIIGTMACESKVRENAWLNTGCNIFDKSQSKCLPMSFWTEQDVLRYLKEFNIDYAQIYGDIEQQEDGKYYTTGLDRSGCVYCLYGIQLEREPNRIQKLKSTHPQIYNFCLKSVQDSGLGIKNVLEYIKVPYK